MDSLTEIITSDYALYQNDCLKVLPRLPDNSIDLSIYSPPFTSLYTFSSSDEDMSNCRTYDEFFEHYEFLVKEMERVTKPGRLSVVHCLPISKGMAVTDFRGDLIRIHQKHGWNYHGEHVLWYEPLKVAIKTRAQGLMHKWIVKDSTVCRAAFHDTILIFRKKGENAVPVTHNRGLSRYCGRTPIPVGLKEKYAGHEDQKTNKLSHWIWQHYASSVWMDIRAERVLKYKEARDKDDERHVCPLLLDTVERVIELYSNPREIVLSPFMGVGSEVYGAVINGRRGIGIELKPSYFRQAVKNLIPPYEHKEDDEPDLGLVLEEKWPQEVGETEA